MALIPSFFKGQKNTNLSTPLTEKLSIDLLKHLIPIRNLSDDKINTFAIDNQAQVYPGNKVIFKCNEPADTVIYLLKGSVSLADINGTTFEIKSTDAKAKFPLSSGMKYTTTATSLSKVSILRVSHKIMASHSDTQYSKFLIPEDLQDSRLLESFSQHFLDDDLQIPSLPKVAIQLGQAMKKEIGIEEAVKIIQLDPVISAKLIEVANCPLYIATLPVKSCFEAVKRIGLNSAQSLVISLSVKNIFTNKSPFIKKYLNQLWQESLYLSSLCYALASASQQKPPEEALLAGLICDIGVIPFLNFVDNLPDDYYDEEEVHQAIPIVKGVVGASILQKWGFTDEFIQVPLMSENWLQSSKGELTYSDIVVLSKLHYLIGKKNHSHLPAITSIPAASKLINMTLSPENSLNILHDAKKKINNTLQLFS